MIKSNMKYNENAVNDFINNLKKIFPNEDINVFNANDYDRFYNETKNCLKCKGLKYCLNQNKGYLYKKNEANFSLEACKYEELRLKEQAKSDLIKILYLPEKLANAKIEDFEVNSESRRKVFSQITLISSTISSGGKIKKGLYLYGGFSIGKTYTLAIIANEYSKLSYSSLLIYFPDLVSELKNNLGTSEYENLINMLKSIDVLLIDDIGSENMTPWLRDEVLGPIINYRLMEEKITYLSSNINPSELKDHIAITKAKDDMLKAERIVSRLTSMVYTVDMNDSGKYNR